MADSVHTLTIKADADLSAISSKVKALGNQFQTLKMPKGIGKEFENDITKINDLIDKYRKQLAKGVNNKADAKALNELGKEIDTVFTHLKNEVKEINNSPVVLKADIGDIEKAEKTVTRIKEQLENAFKQAVGSSNNNAFNNLLSGTGRAKSIQSLAEDAQNAFQTGDIEAYSTAFDKMVAKINAFKPQTVKSIAKLLFPPEDIKDLSDGEILNKVTQQLEEIKTKGAAAGQSTKGFVEKLSKAETSLNNIKTDRLDAAREVTGDMSDNVDKLGNAANKTTGEIGDMADATIKAKSQMDQLKSSTEYFFGLRNMFNLLKRGIRQAINTVSELDKAMTETAVVTDFSVGDMWAKLPLYTEQANQLGATIKDVYEATTLYYQQGLDTDQAIGLANETLKMARIAGMEAAEATDAMTAALRGFNMEINGMSAEKINDVYSKIAATTASNTEELSTAMTKTASLAHSAGMSFEGTTAFLAQMIETTREAPENLGTAMKTIIARFQEMKKNPLEIVDVEGEEVSYNKIDTALQSIGVSLKDANGQFRNLDEVFLEISSKWDSLTQTQQRYIATTAAGSRQQSRFIAMMSNYERVTQLVGYANNSAGASQEQFEKTLDSFAAKVNKLKNAWQEYLMGITDNTIIKKTIDLMTSGLGKINKLIETLTSGLGKIGINESISKSIISLTTAFVGLKAAGRIANRAISGIGGFLDPKSSFFKGFFGGGSAGKALDRNVTSQAAAISNPIVQAIHQLQSAVTGKIASNNISDNTSNFTDFKISSKSLRSAFKDLEVDDKFGIDTVYNKIGHLNDTHQKAILQQLPGLGLSLKNGINFKFKNNEISKKAQELTNQFGEEITKGLNNKTLDSSDVIKIFGTPQNFKQAMAERGEEYGKAAEEILLAGFDKKEYAKTLSADLTDAQKEAAIAAKVAEVSETNFKSFATATKVKGADVANTFGRLGSAAITAGQGIAQLGIQLSNAGFENAGALVTNLGYQISSLGQIAASAGTLIGKITKAGGLGAIITAHPVITAIIVGLTVITGIFMHHQKQIEKIHEAAQKVVDDYETINKSTSDNIATLKQYKEELASLKNGVDENGYNKNLTTDEYDRYLEIVDKIAEINPDIVKYYNAQGHAVLDLNSALEDTLELEEKRQKEGLYNYTSQTSLQKLLDDRATNSTWKKYNNGITYYDEDGNATRGDSLWGKSGATINQLKNAGFDLNRLAKYGINVNDLLKGERASILLFVKNQSKILNEAEKSLTGSWDKVGDDITNSFNELSEAFNEFNEINQPIFEQLATWIGQDNRFQELGAEQKGFVTTGLQSLAMEDMSASDMRKEARKVIRIIDGYFGEGSDYEKIMDQVKKAQENFALDLDEDSYNKAVKDAKTQLQTLIDQSKKIGGAAGKALTNAYTRALDNLENQTDSSVADIIQALNPLSDEIAEAEGAFGKFQEESGSDFSTARKNMSQFYDIMEDEIHNAGYGDASFWQAATEMYGEAAVKAADGSVAAIEALNDKMKPLFEDGADGYNNFVQYLYDSKDKLQKALPIELFEKVFNADGELDFNFDDEDIPALAKALDLSANSFTALLNSMRQFSNVHFGDAQEVKEALMLSDTTGIGQEKVYTNRDELISQIRASGAGNTYTEIEKILSDLFSKGVMTLPGGDQLTETDFEDWKGDFQGNLADWLSELQSDLKITDIPSLIAAFDKMGYSKQDIFEYGKKFHEQGLLQGDFSAELLNTEYDKYVEEQNLDPVVEGLSGIESTLVSIQNLIAGGDVAAGNLNPERLQSETLNKETFEDPASYTTRMTKHFADGLNSMGKQLTEEEYEANLGILQEYRQTANDYLTELRTGLKNVDSKDKDQLLLYDTEINNIIDYINKIDGIIQSGEKAFEMNQGQNKYQEQLTDISPQKIEAEIETTIKTNFSEARGDYVEYKEEVEQSPPIVKPSVVKPKINTNEITAATDAATGDTSSTIYYKGDTSDADKKIQESQDKAENANPIMHVGSEVDETAIDTVITKLDTPYYLTIYPDFQGDWSVHVKKAAKGLNNHISSAGFYAGSAARGHGGTLGPNGKGGLTLTGEKGFEIAWLPSENRSMIVGANGPQMVDLPSDAVVWNHEQSKKIVKQQGIPAGSLADVTGTPGFWGNKPINVNIVNDKTSSGSGSGSNSSSSSSSDKEKDPKRTNWYKEEITRFNLNQSINKITAEIEKVTKSIEKSLDKLGTKYSDIAKNVDTQAKLINQNIANQKALQKSYQDQINLLDKGGRSLWMDIIDSAGESSQKSISTGQFVYKQADGSYAVDKNKVLSYAASLGGDYETQKVNAETIFNTINSELGNLTSGLLSAEKAIQDGEEELQNLLRQVADAFYAWENELTKVYELTQLIEVTDGRRGRLAEETSLILAQVSAGYKSVADAAKRMSAIQADDIKLIEEQINLRQKEIEERQKELGLIASSADEWRTYQAIISENSSKAKTGSLTTGDQAKEQAAWDKYIAAALAESYVKQTYNQDGTINLELNTEKLEEDRQAGNISEKTYEAIKEGYDKMVEAEEALNESITSGFELLTELYEQFNDHLKTMADLENDLIKAFEDTARIEVSKLEALNSSLTAAAKGVLDQVKKNLDARRKAEDNAKTESDIAKKQQRLNALRANTSGGNAVEIAQLEKEIGDAQKSYGRTLEDQMLSQMQTQADEASKQRQEQIDLAKQQIEYNKQAGVYAEMADYLLDNIDKEEDAIQATLLSTQELGRGRWQQLIDDLEIKNQVVQAIEASEGIKQLAEILGIEIDKSTGEIKGGLDSIAKALSEKLTEYNQNMMKIDEEASGDRWAQNNQGINSINTSQPAITQNAAPKTSSNSSSSNNSTPKAKDYSSGWLATLPETNSNYFSASQVQTLQHGLNTMKWSGLISFGADLAIDGIIGPKTTAAIKALQKLVGTTQDGIWGPQTGKATHTKYPKYARGGLNKKTGPAWLDGTPTKPELVLNAQDTKNFIALKDILSGVMRTISHTDTSNIYNSPTNFEINVNVDKISSDYDVDKLTERIKRNIVKDATYRNVTAVRNFR